MKIVVGGGLGFIGSNFTRMIIEKKIFSEVIVVDKVTYAANFKRLEDIKDRFSLVIGSIGDEALLASWAMDAKFFVNFAAETHNDNAISNPALFYETNVMELLRLAAFCAKNRIHLHQVSTDEVFGDLDFDSNESFNPSSPMRPSSPYSASKAAGDLLLGAWEKTFGLSFSISNCSNNFGPGQHQEKLIPTIVRNLITGLPVPLYGDGRNVRDWIHVEDHCEGILKVILGGHRGTFLFGASDLVSNLELSFAIANYIGFKYGEPVKFVSDRPGHDRKYSIDWSETLQNLEWAPVKPKILESIPDLVEWYSPE